MQVTQIINSPVESNCFVICIKEYSPSCIIIDPGTEDCYYLQEFITTHDLIPEYIILTHEHFDHIWGVNKLRILYNLKLICSDECSKAIFSRKKNFSLFYNQQGFEVLPANLIINDLNNTFNWHNIEIRFIETKGHSRGSICILVDNFLFTGDTLIKGLKTVTKLMGGNKNELKMSLLKLNNLFKEKNIVVYPGHGEIFHWGDININDYIN